MRWLAHTITSGLLIAASAPAAWAQSTPGNPPIPAITPQLKPLDQGVEDVDPLSASFRDMQIDLRQPSGFTNAYRVPGSSNQLMRANGALYAVFPQSSYVRTKGGLLPLIPAGTIFHIGMPPAPQENEQTSESSSAALLNTVDTQALAYIDPIATTNIATRIGDSAAAQQPTKDQQELMKIEQDRALRHRTTPARMGPTVANDESYRAHRVGELIARAANAVK